MNTGTRGLCISSEARVTTQKRHCPGTLLPGMALAHGLVQATLLLFTGCGLTGMVAALLGASVTVTDSKAVLPLLKHNVEAFRAEWKDQADVSCE